MQFTAAEIIQTFSRLFAAGELSSLPRRRNDQIVLAALGASLFEQQASYSEHAVNQMLQKWLLPFASPTAIDHAMLRRLLVDLGFLIRDPGGSAYQRNASKILEVIEADAISVDPGEILADVLLKKARRRQFHQNKSLQG